VKDKTGSLSAPDAAPSPATHHPAGVSHNWRDAAEEWRINWRIGIAAFLAIGLSHGSFQAVSSLFVLPLQAAFGWSRGEVAFAFNASLVTALAAPFVGRAVDRFGTRRIMLGGMTITALLYAGLASMNGSLALFYLLSTLVSVIGLSASGLTCSRVVSQAFVRSRGLSLAVARSGLALASAGLPVALFGIITHLGWRAGYLTQAALILFVSLPAVYFWIGGNRSAPLANRVRTDATLPGWVELLHNRRVWFLCLGAGLGYAPATAIMSQLQPMLVSKGLSGGDAAALIGVAGIASFVGALVTGTLVDRFWAPAIAFLFACGSAAGTCLLAAHGTIEGPVAAMAILLIGLGLGAEIDIVAYMVARYFGITSFATLYGVAVFFIALSGALGASMLGIAFDRFGNYDAALFVLAACFLAAGCCYLMLGRYPPSHVEG
jgi:predicted MFS family arabinose efflux permease